MRSRETPAESAKCEREVHSFLSQDPGLSVAREAAWRSPAGNRTESEREIRSFFGALNHVQ